MSKRLSGRTAGRIWVVIAVTAVLAGLLAAPAQAAAITVNTLADEYNTGTACSLREAIKAVDDAADFGGCDYDGDAEITLGAGTHTLTIDDNGASGGDLNVDAAVEITGAGARTTIIDQNVVGDRVMSIGAVEVTLDGMTVTGGNRDPGGGGGITSSGHLILNNVTVTGNTSAGGSGGLGVFDLTATNSTISGNTSGSGAGGVGADGAVDMRNVTISGNNAPTGGGGLSVSGTTTLNNVTITNNTADSDNNGSGGAGGFDNSGTLNVSNTIVAGNFDGGGQDPDCSNSNTINTGGYNLVGNGDDCWPAPGTGDQVGTDASPIDPLLNPLGNFGGETDVHMPQLASPAIDAGNPATPDGVEPNCETTDQRGQARPSGAACDIGSVERQPGDTDTPIDDGGDGTQVGGLLTARCAKKNATIVGTAVGEVLRGGKGKDVMAGLAGKDKMIGKAKRDRMCGAGGKDTAKGGGGKDILKGGKGNDLLVGGAGFDKCVGGPGKDRARGCEKEVKI